MNDLRYPTGRFSPDPNPTPDTRNRHIEQISGTPARLRQAVAGFPLRSVARLAFGHDLLRVPDAFDNSLYDLFGAHGRPPS